MPKIIENKLISEFKGKEFFTRDELFRFFRSLEPDLKEGTFGWRIYDLKNKDVIRTIRRGIYIISYKPRYKPPISKDVLKIAKNISDYLKEIKYCVEEMEWLNEFSRHQTSKRIVIIEIEKEFEETLYYQLKDNLSNDIYLNPDERAMDIYVSESNFPIIIKKLVTRSPLNRRTEKNIKFYTPSLEKILVDLFVDKSLFYFYQGSEMVCIYENAIKVYEINFTKLFSYAKRRGAEQEIKNFLNQYMDHLIKDILDD